MKVAVLGASPKEHRYSHKAVRLLAKHGHEPLPIHPTHKTIFGWTAYQQLGDCGPFDTLTVYVNPQKQQEMLESIKRGIQLGSPHRVIFNPGTENLALRQWLQEQGIEVVENCTLVMLEGGQF